MPQTNEEPLNPPQFFLPFKAVHVQSMGVSGSLGKTASGFLLKENDGLYFYTCWHVATGFDPSEITAGHHIPDKQSLLVRLQRHDPGPGKWIGGVQQFTLQLYDEKRRPLWYQDEYDRPHRELNSIGLRVPQVHDAIKIKVPENVIVSDDQVISARTLVSYPLVTGEKVYVVGFPYGYSTLGLNTPTPVVLTRFIAATQASGAMNRMLLESPGVAGMSGGPVFAEHNRQQATNTRARGNKVTTT